eukprot:jgi/Bigna1/82378/fgenesh1_pg.91_\
MSTDSLFAKQGGLLSVIQNDIRDTIDVGAPAYNDGKISACARVYRGLAEELLYGLKANGFGRGDRNLQKIRQIIEKAMVAVHRTNRDHKDNAWTLRQAFNQILDMEEVAQNRSGNPAEHQQNKSGIFSWFRGKGNRSATQLRGGSSSPIPSGNNTAPQSAKSSIAVASGTAGGGDGGSGDPAKTGYLLKKGLVNTSYKKRFCRLQINKLHYYEDKENVTPKGVIDLDGATLFADSKDAANHEFRITSGIRTYHLRAPSEDDFLSWLASLCTCPKLATFGSIPGRKVQEGRDMPSPAPAPAPAPSSAAAASSSSTSKTKSASTEISKGRTRSEGINKGNPKANSDDNGTKDAERNAAPPLPSPEAAAAAAAAVLARKRKEEEEEEKEEERAAADAAAATAYQKAMPGGGEESGGCDNTVGTSQLTHTKSSGDIGGSATLRRTRPPPPVVPGAKTAMDDLLYAGGGGGGEDGRAEGRALPFKSSIRVEVIEEEDNSATAAPKSILSPRRKKLGDEGGSKRHVRFPSRDSRLEESIPQSRKFGSSYGDGAPRMSEIVSFQDSLNDIFSAAPEKSNEAGSAYENAADDQNADYKDEQQYSQQPNVVLRRQPTPAHDLLSSSGESNVKPRPPPGPYPGPPPPRAKAADPSAKLPRLASMVEKFKIDAKTLRILGEEDLDEEDLFELERSDFKAMGLKYGQIVKLLKAITRIKDEDEAAEKNGGKKKTKPGKHVRNASEAPVD